MANKKLLIIILCGLVLVFAIGGYFLFLKGKSTQEITSQKLKQEYLKFKKEYLEKKTKVMI